MPIVTRPGVEIARTGEWNTSTGKWHCTRAQLADAVRAQDSGQFVGGIIKLGHTDPRFNSPDHDGEPALGQIRNLRLADGGDSLIGDLLIPDWLDEDLAATYPSRSVEADLGVEMADGEKFSMVVTGMALLGVTKPAIQSLAELEHRFMPVAASEYVSAMSVAAAFNEAAHPRGPKGSPGGGKFAAKGDGYKGKEKESGNVKAVQTQLIRLGLLAKDSGKHGGVDGLFGPKTEAAVKRWQKAHGHTETGKVSTALLAALKKAPAPSGKPVAKPKLKPGMKVKAAAVAAAIWHADVDPGLWCREVLEDTVVWANAAGQVWTAPWTEDAGEVSIGDPWPAMVTYTPMADSIAAAAMHNMHRPLIASQSGLEVRHVTASQGATQVDITPEMREALGVDENADEVAVLAALKGLKTPAVTSPPTQENQPGTLPVSTAVSESQNQATSTPETSESVDVERLIAERIAASEKRSGALIEALSGELADRKAKEAADHKQTVISAAAAAGKFTPADRAAWEKDYDEAPAATERILARMAPGTAFAVTASGYAGSGDPAAIDFDAEYLRMFPDEVPRG